MSAVLRREDHHGEAMPNRIEFVPMRRRHLRQVLKIEGQVYPRPWSSTLFIQEMARKADRFYLVARRDSQVIGYGGLMVSGPEGHITTIAVDPAEHRKKVGTGLMLRLIDEAIGQGCTAVSLEVRVTNTPAQKMYQKFGFRPVGIRRGYYVETGEDAIVMWADDVDRVEYRERIEGLRRSAGDISNA